jgi:hypothetical protein
MKNSNAQERKAVIFIDFVCEVAEQIDLFRNAPNGRLRRQFGLDPVGTLTISNQQKHESRNANHSIKTS